MLQAGSQVHKSKRFNIDQADFSLKNGVIMCGHTIVVSKIFGPQILKELHSGHFEEVKMTNMARGYCRWSSIDSDIEKLAKNCANCNAY